MDAVDKLALLVGTYAEKKAVIHSLSKEQVQDLVELILSNSPDQLDQSKMSPIALMGEIIAQHRLGDAAEYRILQWAMTSENEEIIVNFQMFNYPRVEVYEQLLADYFQYQKQHQSYRPSFILESIHRFFRNCEAPWSEEFRKMMLKLQPKSFLEFKILDFMCNKVFKPYPFSWNSHVANFANEWLHAPLRQEILQAALNQLTPATPGETENYYKYYLELRARYKQGRRDNHQRMRLGYNPKIILSQVEDNDRRRLRKYFFGRQVQQQLLAVGRWLRQQFWNLRRR